MSMSEFDERTARLKRVASLMTGNETQEELAAMRIFVGTASPLYRPRRRLWNWFFDTEYQKDLPPWLAGVLILLPTAGVLAIALLTLGLVL